MIRPRRKTLGGSPDELKNYFLFVPPPVSSIYLTVILRFPIILAVLMLLAIPRPTIARPSSTPVIGPGNTSMAKNRVAMIGFMANMLPPTSSMEDTSTDVFRHDNTNAATASTSPNTGKIRPGPTGGMPMRYFIS